MGRHDSRGGSIHEGRERRLVVHWRYSYICPKSRDSSRQEISDHYDCRALCHATVVDMADEFQASEDTIDRLESIQVYIILSS